MRVQREGENYCWHVKSLEKSRVRHCYWHDTCIRMHTIGIVRERKFLLVEKMENIRNEWSKCGAYTPWRKSILSHFLDRQTDRQTDKALSYSGFFYAPGKVTTPILIYVHPITIATKLLYRGMCIAGTRMHAGCSTRTIICHTRSSLSVFFPSNFVSPEWSWRPTLPCLKLWQASERLTEE